MHGKGLVSPFGSQKDQYFMMEALKQAQLALRQNEVPIGAVVVDPEGTIISRAYNQVECDATQAAHAEVRALQQAGQVAGGWRLNGFWLYCTLEPCAMCYQLATLSRCDGIVFGAASPLFGYRLDKSPTSSVYNENTLLSIEGVGAAESAQVLKQFFQKKRNEREQKRKGGDFGT
jgi:tRNA(adenine34) deaminase